MKSLPIQTIEELNWGFNGDRLLMTEVCCCDFCAEVKDCAMFDSASDEYGSVDICENCIKKAFLRFNEFKIGGDDKK